jgi:hypothetical protein
MHPTFDNYQSRYLAWFPRRRINFIGVTENYATDLDYFSRHILHRKLTFQKTNESKKPANLLERGFGFQFLRRFESNNRLDYQNYRVARRASDARTWNGSDACPGPPDPPCAVLGPLRVPHDRLVRPDPGHGLEATRRRFEPGPAQAFGDGSDQGSPAANVRATDV